MSLSEIKHAAVPGLRPFLLLIEFTYIDGKKTGIILNIIQ
jgi:hypothetical protein